MKVSYDTQVKTTKEWTVHQTFILEKRRLVRDSTATYSTLFSSFLLFCDDHTSLSCVSYTLSGSKSTSYERESCQMYRMKMKTRAKWTKMRKSGILSLSFLIVVFYLESRFSTGNSWKAILGGCSNAWIWQISNEKHSADNKEVEVIFLYAISLGRLIHSFNSPSLEFSHFTSSFPCSSLLSPLQYS